MFFDQLYRRNITVKSVLAFEEVGLTLARSGPRKSCFLRLGSKCDDPSIFPGHLDGRNMIEESIMHFAHFWMSTYALYF